MSRTGLRSAVFLAILLVASLTSITLQTPEVEAAPVNWTSLAQIAWRYYQPDVAPSHYGSVNVNTGLHYGTHDWHYITDWDAGNYLIAILDAQALNLIAPSANCLSTNPSIWAAGADCRLDKVLRYLETRTLRSDGLPYWAYNSDTGQPGTGLSRLVTDAADTGRLLVALYVVKTRMPSLAARVDAIFQRVTPTLATLWNVYNTNFIQGKTMGDLYGYYAALGFDQFGFDVSTSFTAWNNLKSGPQVNVYGQLLPRTNVLTEPFLMGMLEIPNLIDDGFKEYAYRVMEAQRGRYQATGYLTGWSEGASDVSTYYLYEWIVHTTGETSPVQWKLDDTQGGPPVSNNVPIVYTKVAVGLHAIFRTSYTQTLVDNVLGKVETNYGFREGIREKTLQPIGDTGWPIQDKENSLILSAARYAIEDPVLSSLHVTTMPSIAASITWNSTETGIAPFDFVRSGSFIVLGLTAPTHVSISGIDYYFNHWEIDGTAQEPPNVVVASISVGGAQPIARTAIAYYLPTSSMSNAWGAIFNAPENTVYFIGNTNPYDNQAMLGAWAKTTNQQYLGLWTRTDWVNQATGQPLVSGNLVPVAGPIANKVLNYYSGRGLTPGFRFSGGYAQIILGNHVLAQMPESQIGTGTDMFVVHLFRDPTGGRYVLAIWGIGAQGTLASGVWLSDVGDNPSWQSRLSSMSDGLYICQWTDANGDAFPQPSEITVIYQGN